MKTPDSKEGACDTGVMDPHSDPAVTLPATGKSKTKQINTGKVRRVLPNVINWISCIVDHRYIFDMTSIVSSVSLAGGSGFVRLILDLIIDFSCCY